MYLIMQLLLSPLLADTCSTSEQNFTKLDRKEVF